MFDRRLAVSVPMIIALTLGACRDATPPADTPPAEPDPVPATRPEPVADPGPAAPTWTSIFNGRDLTGWTPKITGHEFGDNFADTFRVEDGALVVAYDGYEAFEGRFGHIFYETEHSHYRLRLEYRFLGDQVPGGPGWAFRNSGVMIHGQPGDTMAVDQSFPVSIEVQLLGGDGTNERATGNLCTPGTHVVFGEDLVTRHCTNSSSPTYHGDGWVRLEIEVRGHEFIRHVIEDDVVLEYSKPQLDPNDGDAQAWMATRGDELALEGGTISLQSESHPCAFRNIEIMLLDGGD